MTRGLPNKKTLRYNTKDHNMLQGLDSYYCLHIPSGVKTKYQWSIHQYPEVAETLLDKLALLNKWNRVSSLVDKQPTFLYWM